MPAQHRLQLHRPFNQFGIVRQQYSLGTTILDAKLHVLAAIYIGAARKNLLTAATRLVAGEADFRSGIDRLATVR